jgi:hypothetical protein
MPSTSHERQGTKVNAETVTLRMTHQEADSVAYVLMSALRLVSMLPRERTDAYAAAKALFKSLGYGHTTDDRGSRVEITVTRATGVKG